jgi:hypothetical protein
VLSHRKAQAPEKLRVIEEVFEITGAARNMREKLLQGK